jgi:CHC2 zinc finger/RepB DNA-primase from phage plasmid
MGRLRRRTRCSGAARVPVAGKHHSALRNATNAHAFWALTAALSLHELEDANRRLALVLGADPTCVDGARILRVPGTFNFKSRPPRPVRLLRYSPVRYRPADILAILPAAPAAPATAHPTSAPSAPRASDPLLHIEPADYVRILIGREPGRDHKIACPFHEDRTPSFHVYASAERGWTCFGCRTPDGKPLGGDIYKLASLVWLTGQSADGPLRGRRFIEVRERLMAIFFGENADVSWSCGVVVSDEPRST